VETISQPLLITLSLVVVARAWAAVAVQVVIEQAHHFQFLHHLP
jgi:hypothetical protein